MTCYMRHMQWVFEALGLEYEKANRTRVDAALRTLLQVPEAAHCPEVWAAIKALSDDECHALVPRIAEKLGLPTPD